MTDLVAPRRTAPPMSIVDVMRDNAERDPDTRAFGFLTYPGGAEDGSVSWLSTGELHRRGRAVAAAVGEYAAKGDRVLVLLPPGLEFLTGMAGALYAGGAAVACPPPVAGPRDPRTERAVQIAADADVSVVLTTAALAGKLRERWGELGGDGSAPWLALDEVPDERGTDARLPELGGDDLALLQYTSGSTGKPKGVVVSHANVIAHLDQTQALAGLPAGGNVVSWISVYHALGVAGHLLLSQYTGGQALFLTPEDFAGSPIRWLRAISSMPGPVFSCAPNFAFDRCVDHTTVQQRTGLDLSGWQTTFNAAERVRASTITRFTETFGPYGFRPETMAPGFGMTETMLFISGRHADPEPLVLPVDAAELERGVIRPAATDDRAVTLVGVGTPGPHCRVRVVDPATRQVLPEDRVGEVWVDGPIVCQGYWRRDAESVETFQAEVDTGEGPFLRTGDLGFLHGGELVLCGRHKEMIIIRGRNLYPQDVEMSCERVHPLLAGAPAAAFSVDVDGGVQVDGGGEGLVVVQSIDLQGARAAGVDLDELARSLRAAVTGEHEVEVHEVLVVAPDQVSRTVSGKVQRRMCRQRYLDGALLPLAVSGTELPVDVPAPAPLRGMLLALDPVLRVPVLVAELRRRLGALLGLPADAVHTERPLAGLGLESLRAIELRRALERDLEVTVPMADFLRGSVDALADTIAAGIGGPAPSADGAVIAWRPLVADPDNRHEPFPLTEQQYAYFVGRSSGYDLGRVSIHIYVEVDAPDVDTDRLRTALDRLVARQEMLRAVVRSDGTQRILPLNEVSPVALPVADLSTADSGAVVAHLRKTRDELSHQVLPLDSWPMFEVRATRLPSGDARVHVSLDLLVADVASVRLFFLEWGDLYADPAPIPPPAVSFRDYVLALDQIPGSPAHEAARGYWAERIATLPPGPELPLLAGGDRVSRLRRGAELDAARWERLRRRGADRGLTPSVVLLAAFSAVLGRWSRDSRFTVNVPLFNRLPLHPDIDAVIGDFTAVTLLEVDTAGTDGLAGLGERIQRQLGRDLDHRSFSGVEVMRELTKQRGVPAGTFATVVFASAREQGRDQVGRSGALGSSWLGTTSHVVSQTPQVLLDHQVYENDGALAYSWDAIEGLFPAGLLDQMFAVYSDVLLRLADSDGAWQPGGLQLLPAAHRELIAAANHTAGTLPTGYLFSGLAEQAATRPGVTAVVAPDATLTFGELYGRACALGRTLREGGLRPGQLAAVAADRSAAQLVAAIGVQLAGGAYLPIDPDLPALRQDRLLELGEARLVLTRAGGPDRQWPSTVQQIAVDAAAPVDGDTSPLEPVQQPTDVAYVLFTSGSTGEPKGVALSHRASLNTLDAVAEWTGIGPDDVALGLSALSFDLSVWDVFGVPGAGATLVLPEPAAQRDPARWLELMAEHRVTLWNSVPALLQMLVAQAESGGGHPGIAGLRLAWLSGDWIPVDLPDRLRGLSPDVRVVASGGPTETAIWCVGYEVGAVEPGWESIPYGRPLRNATIHVVDDQLDDRPVGVAGEMVIGGPGLADGYWRDPERTSAAFVVRPQTGERIYRSGDLGRWLPDGTLQILGRDDGQVKIGGFRIELGEVEATLAQHPAIREAAVVATGPDRERRQLVAWVVPTEGADGAGDAADAPGGTDLDPTVAEKRVLGDVVADPVQRLDFTLRRPALRSDLDGVAVELPATVDPAETDLWERRSSRRAFSTEPVPLATLAALLEPLRSREGGALPKYRYASAGSLYPVQVYVWVRPGRVHGLDGGSYYHDPAGHRLVPVRSGVELDPALHVSTNEAAFAGCAFEIFLVARMPAIEPLYGTRSRHFCLLEAGGVAQLLEQTAADTGLGLCQVGLLRDEAPVAELLDLRPGDVLLHSLLGGTPLSTADGPVAPGGTGARLRSWLADRLPHYLVPAAVRLTDQLPLTDRGKVDRRELERRSDRARAERAGSPEHVAPASGLERTIAATVAGVLGLDSLGVTDSFFDLGADSVTVVKVYRALRTELDRDFPLMQMFEHTSVRLLARSLAGAGGTATAANAAFDAAARRRADRAERRGRTAPAGEDGQ